MVMGGNAFDVGAEVPEEVKVSVPQPRPVPEFDSELESRLRLLHEVAFVDAEKAVERLDHRNGCLPDTHNADLLRLDEPDHCVLRLEKAPEHRRCHPAGRPSADDCDFSDTDHHIMPLVERGEVHPQCPASLPGNEHWKRTLIRTRRRSTSEQGAKCDRVPPIRIRPAIPWCQTGTTHVQKSAAIQKIGTLYADLDLVDDRHEQFAVELAIIFGPDGGVDVRSPGRQQIALAPVPSQ